MPFARRVLVTSCRDRPPPAGELQVVDGGVGLVLVRRFIAAGGVGLWAAQLHRILGREPSATVPFYSENLSGMPRCHGVGHRKIAPRQSIPPP